MGRLSACLFAVALLASPALGCINDKELPTHEREFRGEYARKSPPPAGPVARPTDQRALVAGGVALMSLAGLLAAVRAKAKD